MKENLEQKTLIIDALRNSGIAVVRTDTIYGIIALASNELAVEKVYAAKHRNDSKQCIVLMNEIPKELPYSQMISELSENAVLPTTYIVPARNEASWLLRGGDTIAYRVTRDPLLRSVIAEVGPIIAPSANPEGLPPASTIQEAKEYFGDAVNVYIDGGEVPEDITPSEILKINEDGKVSVVRSKFLNEVTTSEIFVKEHHSAGGLVFKDNKVLLIHWDPPRSTYDFPKGHLDGNESSEAAAIREVFEETGYKTKVANFIGSNDYYFHTTKGELRHKTVDYFLLELTDDTQYEVARELYETFQNAWVSIEDAPNIITKQINVEIFNKAVSLRQS